MQLPCKTSNAWTIQIHQGPIPTHEQLQQLHKEQDPTLMRSELQALYVQVITSWIYARLYQYLTPYTDPTANNHVQGTKPTEWEFHHAER